MRTSIVYILVSTSDDFFYEQTLISAWSARYWNPDVKILCVMDELTDATLTDKRTALLEIIDEKIVVDLSDGGSAKYTAKERSRMLKTNLRNYVCGDILFVDSDTIICGSLADVDSFTCAIGAVWDGHHIFNPTDSYQVVQRAELLGHDVSKAKDYYNSGVMYMKDTQIVHEFTKAWYTLYMKGQSKGVSFDQPALLAVNIKHHMISSIDDIYNCQILNGGLPFLTDAKIIHAYNVFGSIPFFYLADSAFYRKIKQQGKLFDEDKKRILSAKKQFGGEYVLVYGENLRYWHSSLLHLYKASPNLFKICEFIGKVFFRLYKKT